VDGVDPLFELSDGVRVYPTSLGILEFIPCSIFFLLTFVTMSEFTGDVSVSDQSFDLAKTPSDF
jgi:hypothetical protein